MKPDVAESMTRGLALALSLTLCLLASACPGRTNGGGKLGRIFQTQEFAGQSLAVLSGSENKDLEPIIQRFNTDSGCEIKLDYKGSVDIMLALSQGKGVAYDAVWPANSLWITLGDKSKLVKHAESMFRSPVIMGVKLSVAKQLGWVGKDVMVKDILAAAQNGDLRFCMTSATQSNSGASAYIGYLYAFAGSPDVLTEEDLAKPELRANIKRILGTVNRSSGSSGWLKDFFIEHYDDYDAMVNYEVLTIEANLTLAQSGREPLYAVYPVDGLAIADSPLGYVDKGDASKEKLFLAFQQYLQGDAVQRELLATGRRIGNLGEVPKEADLSVFNPDWGIDLARTLQPIRLPEEKVLRRALELYQVAFRKPSYTVYALDFSGSMEGEGVAGLKRAMRTLLDPKRAAEYLLQPSPDDVTVVVPFNGGVIDVWTVKGNDPAELGALVKRIDNLQPDGETNIYDPVVAGIRQLRSLGSSERSFPAVILMTDGQSNQGSFEQMQASLKQMGVHSPIPIFAITFGAADESQLKTLADYSSGKMFDGNKDLTEAFRGAKGFN